MAKVTLKRPIGVTELWGGDRRGPVRQVKVLVGEIQPTREDEPLVIEAVRAYTFGRDSTTTEVEVGQFRHSMADIEGMVDDRSNVTKVLWAAQNRQPIRISIPRGNIDGIAD